MSGGQLMKNFKVEPSGLVDKAHIWCDRKMSRQYCENDYTTQSNLQIQCNPYQTTNDIFHRTRTKNFTICMETRMTPNSQSNLEKEKDTG